MIPGLLLGFWVDFCFVVSWGMFINVKWLYVEGIATLLLVMVFYCNNVILHFVLL